jgi:hypothetical protein
MDQSHLEWFLPWLASQLCHSLGVLRGSTMNSWSIFQVHIHESHQLAIWNCILALAIPYGCHTELQELKSNSVWLASFTNFLGKKY